MDKLLLFCISFLLLVAGGALAQDVRDNFDNTADFSKTTAANSIRVFGGWTLQIQMGPFQVSDTANWRSRCGSKTRKDEKYPRLD